MTSNLQKLAFLVARLLLMSVQTSLASFKPIKYEIVTFPPNSAMTFATNEPIPRLPPIIKTSLPLKVLRPSNSFFIEDEITEEQLFLSRNASTSATKFFP